MKSFPTAKAGHMYFDTADKCIKRVKRYLDSDMFSQPFFINTENREEYLEIRDNIPHGLKILRLSSACATDDDRPRLDEFLEDVLSTTNKSLLLGYPSYLKLLGETIYYQYMENLFSSSIQSWVVVLCFQAEQLLSSIIGRDIRGERRISFLNGSCSKTPQFNFISQSLRHTGFIDGANGFKSFLQKIEDNCPLNQDVYTALPKQDFSTSITMISEVSSAYDAIVWLDPNFSKNINRHHGSEEQWDFLLLKYLQHRTFNTVLQKCIKASDNLRVLFSHWPEFDDGRKWIFFISLKAKGTDCKYINDAVDKAETTDELVKLIFCNILDIDHSDRFFNDIYSERKALIQYLSKEDNFVSFFCQAAEEKKGDEKIHYLTDSTDQEKFEIVKCLCKCRYPDDQINEILTKVYPDLANYLLPFNFNNKFLDNYFQLYKYQKITNHIRDDFLEMVKYQATNRDYNRDLPCRSAKFDLIDKTDTFLFFVDALGVEFLGYIIAKCRDFDLQVDISICHCNLPSITSYNKEFLDGFDPTKVFSNKELDEIKHDGKDDFDYQKTRDPIHIVKELEVLLEVLNKIKTKLTNGDCMKAIIISDHGASRLAVINDNTNFFDVDAKGTNSGRCCPYSSELPKIEYAIEENGYYALASYDRFKGGRAASVEVHGGATLEEVVIPIIELTQHSKKIKVSFVSPTVIVSFRKKAEIILVSTSKLVAPTLLVSGKYYEGALHDDNKIRFIMHDLKQVGEYSADVYDKNNLIFSGLKFTVEKEGSKEIDLL